MKLIDEQNNPAIAGFNIVQNSLQAFLKFATEFCAGDQCAHIEREDGTVFQAVRHIAANDTLGETLSDGSFANARLTDQHRIVFRFTRKNANCIADFRITANYRIKLVLTGKLDQILTIFFERVICGFRILTGHTGTPANSLQSFQEFRLGDIQGCEQRANRAVRFFQQTKKQMLNRDIFVAHLLHLVFCFCQRLGEGSRHIRLLVAAGNLWQTIDRAFTCGLHLLRVQAEFAHQLTDQTVFLTQQRIQQMHLFDLRVSIALRKLLGGLQGLQGFLGEAVGVHPNHPPLYSGTNYPLNLVLLSFDAVIIP